MRGGAGNDRLAGETLLGDAGDDVLTGGDKNSRLRGGPGADRFACGAGADTVSVDGGVERLSRDCETARLDRPSATLSVKSVVPAICSGRATFSLPCRSRSCAASIEVRTPGRRLLARGGAVLRAGTRSTLAIKVGAQARRALSAGRALVVVTVDRRTLRYQLDAA